MQATHYEEIDPDPFIIAGVCLQSAAVILQLVQISLQKNGARSSVGAINNRHQTLERLEDAIDDFDDAISKVERTLRRESKSPEKEVYEASFRVSVGIMQFSAKGVKEFHDKIAESTAKLASLTRWIGHIIHQDPDISSELGAEISEAVAGASERINAVMANGGAIEAVLNEAKMVRDACKAGIAKRLNDRRNL